MLYQNGIEIDLESMRYCLLCNVVVRGCSDSSQALSSIKLAPFLDLALFDRDLPLMRKI